MSEKFLLSCFRVRSSDSRVYCDVKEQLLFPQSKLHSLGQARGETRFEAMHAVLETILWFEMMPKKMLHES